MVNPDSDIIDSVHADDPSSLSYTTPTSTFTHSSTTATYTDSNPSLLADTPTTYAEDNVPSASFSYSGSLDLSNTGAITGDKTNTIITMTNNITVEARLINNYNLQISSSTSNSGSGGSSNNSSTTLEGPTTINPIDNTTNPSTFNGLSTDNMLDNTWGYSWGNTSTNNTDNSNDSNKLYKGITTTPVTIDNTGVDSNGTVRYTKPLTFAAKFSKEAIAGHYTTTVTLSLAAAPKTLTTYTLAYDTQGASNTIPNTTCSTYFDSCNVTITNTVPTRTNYTFLGWGDTNTATSAQYTTNGTNGTANTITLSAATTTNKAKTIYAVWESQDPWSSITTMQQMTTTACTAAEVGKEKSLTDSRDTSNSYKVRKMPDGKCWMIENLRIMNKNISSADSNLAEGASFTVPASNISGFSDNAASNAYLGADANGTSTGYYTWCATTAGTCSSAPNANDIAPSSICPKGWKLPTGGQNYTTNNTSEFYNLIMNGILKDNSNISSWKNNVSSNHYFTSSDAVNIIKGSPYNFAFTGGVYYSSYSAPASDPFGRWWSSTAYNRSDAYHLYIGGSNSIVGPGTGNNDRRRGFAVRCVAE